MNCQTCTHKHVDPLATAVVYPSQILIDKGKRVEYCELLFPELQLVSGFADGYAPGWCPLKENKEMENTVDIGMLRDLFEFVDGARASLGTVSIWKSLRLGCSNHPDIESRSHYLAELELLQRKLFPEGFKDDNSKI